MSEHQQIFLNNQEFVYDLDPDLMFNFNHDHIEFVYTSPSSSKETTETILAMHLSPKKKLNIQSVLCCRTLQKKPMLFIIAIDPEQINHIFCYNVIDKQIVQVLFKNPIEHEIIQSAITRDPFEVVFLSRKYSDKEPCHALVIGTVTGNTTLVLINIDESTHVAKVLSTENITSEQDLGHVSSIYILPPGKVDRRVGHSDPQILLGYSKGAILIYRFRANVYSASAERLRHPVNLSEFAEYPKYPITRLSCARPSDSLVMTVAFAQEKPIDNPKYQYSHPYIKLVEIHGDTSKKQRKIINPSQPMSTIMEAKLSTSTLRTSELESIMQLAIIFQKKNAFELNIWHVSLQNVHQELALEFDLDACLTMINRRNKLRSDDLIGYYKHTPQKLVQRILQHEKDSKNEDGGFKRKHDDDDDDEEEEVVILKKGKIIPVPAVVSHSDEEEAASTDEKTGHDANEDIAMEDVFPTDRSTDVNEEEKAEDDHLPENTVEKLKRSTIIVETIIEESDKTNSNQTLASNDIASKEVTVLVEKKSVENTTKEPVKPVEKEAEELAKVNSIKLQVEESRNAVVDKSVNPVVDENGSLGAALEESIEFILDLPGSSEEEHTVIESIVRTFDTKQRSVQESIIEPKFNLEELAEPNSNASKEPLDDASNEKLTEGDSDMEPLNQQEQDQGAIADDYAFVDMKDVPEDLAKQGTADQQYITAEQAFIAEDATISEQDSVAEKASAPGEASIAEQASVIEQAFIAKHILNLEQAPIPEQASLLEDSPSFEQQEEYTSEQTSFTEQREESIDENEFASEQEQDFAADSFDGTQPLEDYDQEMDYGQDYVDMDGNVCNEPLSDTQADDVCVIVSSHDGSDEEGHQDDYGLEEDESTLEKENRQPTENYSEECVENDYLENKYDEEVSTTTRDDLSDIGSIQQSFVPAGSTCSTNDEVSTPVSNSVPTIDYVPVMQQDLLRLLQDAGVPSSIDMGINQDVDNIVGTSSNINTIVNENDDITLLPPTEIAPEDQHLQHIEQAKLEAEKQFSDILSNVIGHRDIDTFMNQTLPQDQLQEIGSSCWLDSNPRLKLMMVRYCDKYKMAEEVVTLCKGLKNANDLSSEEDTEWKNIYNKYLLTYSSFVKNTTINIFTAIGRRQLLDKETHHIQLNTFTSYNDSSQKRCHQDYMQYYGFGARK